MFQINDWLWIGNYRDTNNLAALQQHQIGAMLQLAEAVPQPNIEHVYLAVEDGESLPHPLLQQGLAFIHQQHLDSKRILVACGAGISRSTSYAAAAIKEAEGVTLREALRSIRVNHPDAFPHPALWVSMLSYFDDEAATDDLGTIWDQLHNP